METPTIQQDFASFNISLSLIEHFRVFKHENHQFPQNYIETIYEYLNDFIKHNEQFSQYFTNNTKY